MNSQSWCAAFLQIGFDSSPIIYQQSLVVAWRGEWVFCEDLNPCALLHCSQVAVLCL